MAYIVNTTETDTAVAASYTVTLGAHQSGDLLLVFLTNQVGGTTTAPDATATTAGWAILAQERSGTAVRHAVAWVIATSGAMTNPTFTGSNDDWLGSCVVVRDAHASPFGALADGTDYNSTAYTAATTYASGALTTAADGCLVFYSFGKNGPGSSHYHKQKLADVRAASKQSMIQLSQTVAYLQQQSAGAIPSNTTYSTNSAAATGIVCAVRNVANGALQPDIRPDVTELRWYGSLGANYDATTTWEAPSALSASVGTNLGNAINCSASAPTVAATTFTGDAVSNWGSYTSLSSAQNASLAESASGAGIWVGGTHAITSTNMSGKVFGFNFTRSVNTGSDNTAGNEGVLVAFGDGTNWAAFQVQSLKNNWITNTPYSAFVACGNSTPFSSSGSINWSAVTRVGYFWHRKGSSTASFALSVRNACLFGTTALTGGGASRPATFADFANAMNSWAMVFSGDVQGSAQVLGKTSVLVGDGGTNTTYFDASASSFEYPQAFGTTAVSQMKWNATSNAVALSVKAGASDTINLAAGVCATDVQQNLTIDAASSTSATYSFAGTSFVGWLPTWKTGVNVSSATFKECGEIDAKGSAWTDCTIAKTTSTDAAIAFSEDGGSLTRCTIDVTGTSAAYHLELGTAVTGATLTDVTFTGTPTTDKVHVKATSGTVTITTSGTTSLVAGDVTSDGATVVIDAPAVERGISFTGLQTGSTLKVFETGTTTELFNDTNTATTEEWSEALPGSITVDYTIYKDGYLPVGPVTVTVTGAISGGVLTVPITQIIDRAFVTPTGLTWADIAVDLVNSYLKCNIPSTVQNFYSLLIQSYRSQSSLANQPFPMQANGPSSFIMIDGWETRGFTTAGTGIANTTLSNFSRDGLRYTDANGDATAMWAALLSVGVLAGQQVRYQQQDGLGTTDAATTGNIDQLIQVYGDVSHGAFDYRDWLVLKVQAAGYDQAEAIAQDIYETIEDQLYVVGLTTPVDADATWTADATVTVTPEDVPVEWPAASGKFFSTTITDTTDGHTGLQILQAVRAENDFNWSDLVRPNGDKFKTVTGNFYGDLYTTPAGVRVVMADGTTPHPDFNLFNDDTGSSPYIPPVVATISITNLPVAGNLIRLQIYNLSTDTIIYSDDPAGTSYTDTYIDGVGITAGDTLRVRFVELNAGTSFKFFNVLVEATADGFNIDANNYLETDDVYATNAVDGSSLTVTAKFSADFALPNPQINLKTTSNFIAAEFYAFWCYLLTDATGIGVFWGAITAPDVGNYRINVSVVDMYLDNETTASKRQTDAARIYRSDSIYPVLDPTTSGYGIDLNWQNVVYVVSTGGSALTPSESAQLMALPSAAVTSAQVLADAQVTPIHSNMKQSNDETIIGDGTEGNKFRSHLVP